jgi:hypothetical protein
MKLTSEHDEHPPRTGLVDCRGENVTVQLADGDLNA